MKILMNFLKGIFQSSIGKWILYALIGLILFKIFTFVLGLFFPPAAFILNNIIWIAIATVGVYFFVKFRGEKKPKKAEDIQFDFMELPGNKTKFVKPKPGVAKIYSGKQLREKPEKSEMDKLFDIIDEETKKSI